MPGLAPICGIGPLVDFGGRTIEIHGRTLRDMGSIENRVVQLRGDPIRLSRQLVRSLDDAHAAKVAALQSVELIRHKLSGATHQDMGRWLSSFEGRVFSVWRAVRHSVPEYDDAVRVICEQVDAHGMSWLEEIEWAMEVANGRAEHQLLVEIRSLIKTGDIPDDGRVNFPNYDALYRAFSRDPFSMSSDEILDLTLHQIQILAKDDDNNSDERDVEMVTKNAKGMTKKAYRLVWGAPYEHLADNVASGRHVLSNLH